jgi:hypothetical protein
VYPELLSGHRVAVRLPALRAPLEGVYGPFHLDAAETEVASVPWDQSPAVRQEPALNPSYGTGDVRPGTLLHSGEMTASSTDLAIRGRGFDFAFTRTYRSQTVGGGPLGPGWDHNYRFGHGLLTWCGAVVRFGHRILTRCQALFRFGHQLHTGCG